MIPNHDGFWWYRFRNNDGTWDKPEVAEVRFNRYGGNVCFPGDYEPHGYTLDYLARSGRYEWLCEAIPPKLEDKDGPAIDQTA